jgi:cytochrome P450 family 6
MLGDLAVKKGTIINYNPRAIFYDPNIFEDPEIFRPERWQHENPKFSINELTNLAFGGGPRSCIGKHLGLLETKIGLVKFMKRYTNVT